jgi:hypothetical protein
MSAEICLSMVGAKQLRTLVVPAGAVHPAGVCSRHCIALHQGACRGVATSEAGEEVWPPSPTRCD